MTVWNTADDVRLGDVAVDKVMRGTTLVWEREKNATVALSTSVTSLNKGASVTLTATCGAGQPAGSTVRFRLGSPTGTIVATDTASPWSQNVVPTTVGVNTYYAELVANPPWIAAMSSGRSVTVYQPTSVSLAKSGDIIIGQSVTLTATVVGASSGTVRFRAGSTSGTIVGTDTASPWSVTVSPTSTTTYYAEYVANGYIRGAFSSGMTVTVSPLIGTSVSLSTSKSTINSGSSVTLSATVSGASSGTVRFRTGSSSGSIVATDTSNPWSATLAPTSSTTYYATYDANGVYAGSSSSGRTVTVRKLVKKTWEKDASWDQSYQGNRSQRSTSYLYYGYYSSVWGMQSSLIGFNLPSDLVGCDSIDEIEFKLYNVHHYYNSGGLIPIGYHDYTSKPSSFSTSRIEPHIKTMPGPKPGWSTEALGSYWKPHFQSGDAKGIILGWANSNSLNYYGYADSQSTTREPRLKIVYNVWE